MSGIGARPTVLAGSGNRVVALFLDLLLLMLVASAGLLPAPLGQYLWPLLVFLYFATLPLSPLQGTLGKWICRIKLCDGNGTRLTWRASAVRAGATLCWFGLPWLFGPEDIRATPVGDALATGWWLAFALPWAPIEFLPRRQSLFDLLAGSLVVRYGADAESIRNEPLRRPGWLKAVAAVAFCLLAGLMLELAIEQTRFRNLYSRVAYAIEATRELRDKVEAFHEVAQRWPTATELDVPAWTPYRDGGGYRLAAEGRVVVSFSVLPELKGHSIRLVPARPATEGPIAWKCEADAGFNKRYLPHHCR